MNAFVQEREFAESCRQNVVLINVACKNTVIGFESDFRAGVLNVGLADNENLRRRFSDGIFLLVNFAVSLDNRLKISWKRVNAGYADAVQTAETL